MGTFSWLKADGLTKVANVVCDKSFKFLIPIEFGGGFIKEKYQAYGDLGIKKDGNAKYDIYELLAFWNKDMLDNFEDTTNILEYEGLRYDGEFPKMKEKDKYTYHNRSLGIDIGCGDDKIDKLKYPLKLVSASYKGTYEDLDTYSYGDPYQGCCKLTREKLDQIRRQM